MPASSRRSRLRRWRTSGRTATPRRRSRATPRRASARTWRCASTPRACWAASRRLVLHGGGNTSVKTRMADITGATIDVLCVKGSGWDMGTIEAPGLPAVRLAPLRELARLQALSRRGHGQRPAQQPARRQVAQPVGRDAAARLPAAQIHRPHPFQRRAGADRPARRRGAGGRRLRQARGAGALRHAGLRARQEMQRGRQGQSRRRRADPAEARHLLDGRHGGRSLCAHDRPRDAGREAARQGDAQDLPGRHAARRSPRAAAEIAPILRGLLSIPAKSRRPRGGAALRVRVPQQSRDPGLRRRQGDRALQPAGPGDARPRHPHQGHAAHRAGARGRQARCLQDGRQGRARQVRRRLSRLFRAPQRQADAGEEGARPDPARRAGAGRRPVRRRQHVRRTPRSPPTSPRPRSR